MIEILESRIAPASVFVFTDVDGDHVTISSSKGDLNTAGVVTLGNATQAAVGFRHQLMSLQLGAAFSGASITITAKPSLDLGGTQLQGDGFVNVGEINARAMNQTPIDLKSVTIHGDLGQIIVGSGTGTAPALGSLDVQSMGIFGLTTGATSANSYFMNGVKSITVAQDVDAVQLRAEADTGVAHPDAKIGSVFVGGNLIGGAATGTGEIVADGIGSVKIMQSVIGGSATDTGRIAASNKGTIGSVYIGGSLIGGSAQATGAVYASTTLGSVTVKQSVVGGSAITSGGIDGESIGSVAIGGDLRGTTFSSANSVDHTAFIRAQKDLKSVTIVGSIISGSESGGGTLTFSGAVQAGLTLGTVKVLGNIEGTATDKVVISGQGFPTGATGDTIPTTHTQDPAITSVSIGGTATYMQVEAGYDLTGMATDGDSQIGSVTIAGDLIASDIIAGVKSGNADPTIFGGATDSLIARPAAVTTDGVYATIASIVVGGQIEGAGVSGDSFGIEAQWIKSFKTGGLKLPLMAGAGNDGFALGITTNRDVHVRELGGK